MGNNIRKVIVAAVICLVVGTGISIAQTLKAIKVVHLNDYQVFVSCTNGRTPETTNVAGQLAISCQGRQQ
jgi:hypothetical protein